VSEKEDFKWANKEQYLYKPTHGRTTHNRKRVQHVEEEERNQEEENDTNSGEEGKEVEGESQPIHSIYFNRVSHIKGNSNSTKPKSNRTSHNKEYRNLSYRYSNSNLRGKTRDEGHSKREKPTSPSSKLGNKRTYFNTTTDGLPPLPGKNFQ